MTASVFSKTTRVVSLLLLLPVAVLAQQSTSYLNLHQWGAVTLFHGLPSDRVRAIAQDRDGWLWFGTDNGLAKYDGRRVQKVASAGLPAGAIRALAIDPAGRLWVAGDSGASVLFGSGFKPVPETAGVQINAIAFTSYSSSYGDELRAVLASEQGRLFFCSLSDIGEFTVETLGAQQQPLLAIDKNVPLPLTSLLQTQEGLLVGSMGRGLLRLSGGELKEVMVRPRHYFIRALASGGRGRVWVGIETRQREGLYLLESGRLQAVEAATGSVTTLHSLDDGQLWAGTTSEGAFFRSSSGVEQYTFESSIGSLRSDMVLAVFVDREGVVWFGTDRGVCRYDARSPRAERISEEPESNFVRALLRRSDGSYWAGTNRGLFIRRASEYYWTMVEDVGSQAIFALLELPDRRVLVGTISGLYTVDDAGVGRVSGDPTSIRDIASFRSKIFLAAYGSGLGGYENGEWHIIWQGEGHEREVISLYAEEERLWIGTAMAGLFVYDGKSVTPASIEALKSVAIRDIAGTGSAIWLATSNGLYRDQNGQLTHFLSGIDIRSLSIDGHNLWCATSVGLYRLHTGDPERLQSRLDTEFGLPSANTFALMLEQGVRVWVGTNRGLASYTSNLHAPILRAARALGSRNYRVEEIERGLFLEYPQNSLLVDYLALSSRTFPEQFLYRFMLRDASGRLIEERQSRDGQFLVEQLAPGRYSLEARAFTHDLVGSEKYSFTIQVASAPFPWTSAALSALLLAALSALWWGYKQNRKLASSNLQLAQTRLRLAEETEKERRRISRDLHDQTLADLRKLLMMTDKVQSEGFNPAIFRAEIESISTEIRRICEDLSPSVLTNVGLSAALEWALQSSVAHMPTAERFEYEFLCDEAMEERLLLSEDIEIQIYRIVQEVINNICRHSGARRVKMTVALSAEGDLRVSLEDDGKGMGRFNPEGRGLVNIRSRASMIDASVQWKERTGGGVCFLLFKRGAGRPL